MSSEPTPWSTEARRQNNDSFASIIIIIGVVMTVTVVVIFITAIVYVFISRRNERKARRQAQLTQLKILQPHRQQSRHQPPRPLPISTASTDITDSKASADAPKEKELPSSSMGARTPVMASSAKSQSRRKPTRSPRIYKTPVIEPPVRRSDTAMSMQKTQPSPTDERGYIEEFIANQSIVSTMRRPDEPDGPVDDSRLLDAFQI